MLPSGNLLPKIPSSVTGHRSPQQCHAPGSTAGKHHRAGIQNYQSHLKNEGEERRQRGKCPRKEDANTERKSSREDEEFERNNKVKLHSRLHKEVAQREQEVSALNRKVNYSEESQEVAWQEIHINSHLW